MSAEAIHGVNELEINGERYLLAGGNKTHLVALGVPESERRPAVDRDRCERDGQWQSAYDLAALVVEQWQPSTVCGRRWQIMRAGDGPPIGPFSHSAHAPDCKTCLRIMSTELKSSPADDRIGLVASLAIEEAMQRGSANISGVPGDQADALRSAIREACRGQRLRCETRAIDGLVIVWLRADLPSESQAELKRELVETLGRIASGSASDPVDRTIQWSIWG